MKLHAHYALIVLLASALPAPFIRAESEDHHRKRSGSVIEATSLQQLQSILANNQYVVVDFYATWCRPCQRMLPEFGKVPASFTNNNVVFVKIEVSIAGNSYGVKMLPTVACFANNQEISRSTGFKSTNDLVNYVKSVFKNLPYF